jgi:NAD(P)-dependent dehydrogenase (short-subunit alcohol dehydrogenase family)
VQGGMLASLRAEVPRVWKGARVNVVAPGPVETERWAGECERDPGQMWREAQATVSQTFQFSYAVIVGVMLVVMCGVALGAKCIANDHRRHYASPFPSKLSPWLSYRWQVITSAVMFMGR